MSFWRGMSVLVTGHTGFKGSWLSLWLARLGAQVHGLALPPPSEPSLFVEAQVADRLASHRECDVRDADGLRQALRETRPEIVFHLAAQTLVRRSYAQPAETFATNVMGAVNLLQAVRDCETVRVVVMITSDKCYENREWPYAYRETDPLGGRDPYSASKAAQELAIASWRRSFLAIAPVPVSVASARAGNVIGGGDWAEDRLVPDCIRALERGETLALRYPNAVRPWQHVLEPLSGYLTLAEHQWEAPRLFAEAWNFGPYQHAPVSVGAVVATIESSWGGRADVSAAPSGLEAHEHHMLMLDIGKAMAKLGWHPRYDTTTAISETVTWYRRRQELGDDFDAAACCEAQIAAYEARAPINALGVSA